MTRINERGITLPEVLAGILIAAIIGTIAYMILFAGMKTKERVIIESQLRDEADIIMAHLIKDFYTVYSENYIDEAVPNTKVIASRHLTGENGNYYITLTSGKKIGFIDGQVFVSDNDNEFSRNQNIKLDGSKIEEIDNSNSQFKITLQLEEIITGHKLELTSVIGIID